MTTQGVAAKEREACDSKAKNSDPGAWHHRPQCCTSLTCEVKSGPVHNQLTSDQHHQVGDQLRRVQHRHGRKVESMISGETLFCGCRNRGWKWSSCVQARGKVQEGGSLTQTDNGTTIIKTKCKSPCSNFSFEQFLAS